MINDVGVLSTGAMETVDEEQNAAAEEDEPDTDSDSSENSVEEQNAAAEEDEPDTDSDSSENSDIDSDNDSDDSGHTSCSEATVSFSDSELWMFVDSDATVTYDSDGNMW